MLFYGSGTYVDSEVAVEEHLEIVVLIPGVPYHQRRLQILGGQ